MAPLFAESDEGALKAWLVRRLLSASEADPDVLADYILALLRHDQGRDEIMETCISQLTDFMSSDPKKFVRELFDALDNKAYLQVPAMTRKRSFDTSTDPQLAYSQRTKTARYTPQQTQQPRYPPPPQQYAYNAQQWPPPVPQGRGVAPWSGQGHPPQRWAPPIPMQAMMPVPGWPGPAAPMVRGRVKGTCFDYLEKGICLRGVACPFDHGLQAPAVISRGGDFEPSDAYDPMRPGNIVSTPGVPPAPVSLRQPHLQRGVDTRFEILKGPSQDSSNTTLVVENLPAEHKNETDVREYFSQFGTLKEIIVNAPRGKALLVYEDHESALKAWNDPRPVFNNRFVKIFWKRTENVNPLGILPVGNGRPGSSGSEAKKEERDPEEVERELEAARAAAAKAQLQHEEKLRKKAELAKKKEELEQQRLELLERQRVEKERLLERIRKAQAAKATPTPTEEKKEEVPVVEKEGDGEVNGEKNGDGVDDEPDERKLKLQKMLNDLQSQAKALNIPPSEYTMPLLSDSRTKTSYRPYRGRPFRARGRGFFAGGSRSLDLRPKGVLVPIVSGGKEESRVREIVMMNFGDAVVNTEEEGGMLVAFKERYEAEEFMGKLREIGFTNTQWRATAPVTPQTKVEDASTPSNEVESLMEIDQGEGEEEEGEITESEGRWKR